MPVTPIPAMPPAPSPTDDRATFTSKSFNYFAALPSTTTAMNTLAAQVQAYGDAVDVDAAQVAADRLAVEASTALAANYAGAAPWAAGTYAQGAVVYSNVNQRLYRKTTASSATATDPSADPTNWTLVNAMVPFTPVTTSTQLAVSGGRYSLQRTSVEGAVTNLLLWSEDFNNAVWSPNGLTVSANTTNSPDGDLLADTLTNVAGSVSLVDQTVSVPASATNDYYASIFVKRGNSSTVVLNVFYTTGAETNLSFNFDTLVVTGAAYSGEYIAQYFGDGWWRIGYRILRDSSGARTTIQFRFWESSRGAAVAGNTTIVWGAQLEAGANPTSYVKSASAQGTRAAGIVPPQRLVFPASPANNAYVSVQIANGIETNVVHPNGSTLEGTTGPALIDFTTGSVDFQYLNGTWRAV